MLKVIKIFNLNNLQNVRYLRSTSKFIRNDVEELKEIEENIFDNKRNEPVMNFVEPNRKQLKTNLKVAPKPKPEIIKPKPLFDENLNLSYKKLQMDDPLLANLLLSVKSKKRRKQNEQILVEGRRLILDAIQCGLKLDYIIFSQKEQLEQIKEQIHGLNAEIIRVPYANLKIWSGLTTCPGLMGVFTKNLQDIVIKDEEERLPITVICDNIREPKNMGSIIRSCAAIPCREILTLKGCTDPWDSKCLRSGAGGHFRVPITEPMEWDVMQKRLPTNFSFYIAENNPKRTNSTVEPNLVRPYYETKYQDGQNLVLVIGGETYGVRREVYEFLNVNSTGNGNYLYIPLAKGVDSLNTASAISIILFEMKRKILLQNAVDSNSD